MRGVSYTADLCFYETALMYMELQVAWNNEFLCVAHGSFLWELIAKDQGQDILWLLNSI